MKINDFLEAKEVTLKELDTLFIMESCTNPYNAHTKVCPNCGDVHNLYTTPSGPWTLIQHCNKCNRIIATVFGDKMGGQFDTVLIYAEK